FTAGVYVAAADVNRDGKADIITGAGAGGGPNVAVFNGADLSLLHSLFPFDPSFTGGVRVAALDAKGDGRVNLLAVAGPGAGADDVKTEGVERRQVAVGEYEDHVVERQRLPGVQPDEDVAPLHPRLGGDAFRFHVHDGQPAVQLRAGSGNQLGVDGAELHSEL